MGLAIKDELVSQGRQLDELTDDVDKTSSKMKQVPPRCRHSRAGHAWWAERAIDRAIRRMPTVPVHVHVHGHMRAERVMTELCSPWRCLPYVLPRRRGASTAHTRNGTLPTLTHEVPTQTVHTGTLAIPTVSQAQHVMTKLLKSKDRGLFCCILALTLCLCVLVYFVFFV